MTVALFHLWNTDIREIVDSTFACSYDEVAGKMLTKLADRAKSEGMIDPYATVMREWSEGILSVMEEELN